VKSPFASVDASACLSHLCQLRHLEKNMDGRLTVHQIISTFNLFLYHPIPTISFSPAPLPRISVYSYQQMLKWEATQQHSFSYILNILNH